jgi:hypothetical protein
VSRTRASQRSAWLTYRTRDLVRVARPRQAFVDFASSEAAAVLVETKAR